MKHSFIIKYIKILMLLLVIQVIPCYGKTIILKLAILEGEYYLYYHELLQKALADVGYQLVIERLTEYPQRRIAVLLDTGQISLHWFIRTAERDKRYVPIRVGITNNLIGRRVLVIPKGEQGTFNQVKNLNDLRKLNSVTGFGENWFDIKVWQANQLPYKVVEGNWQNMFLMIFSKKRGIDNLSLGVNQVLNYADHYPFIDVEKKLLLIYERDFWFYVTESYSEIQPVLEEALINAKETGLMDKLIRKHWAGDFEKLNYDQRIKIHLKTPN
ncbi:MAG: hypothetical protein MJB14_01780 [Spirochaetes bacterium]|nr:hypothetical protein [Spirochaetota bacterium]